MDQHDKSARELRGGVGPRSTAPAGTPYPVAPNPAPAVPAPTASQPRTVGGHTARLLVPEDDLPLDPLRSSSIPMALDDTVDDGGTSASSRPRGFVSSPPGPLEARPSSSPPQSLGLGPLPETNDPPSARTVGGTARFPAVSEDEAAAARKEALEQAAQKAARKSPAPQRAEGSAASASAPGRGSTTLALLLAPASVTVGLIFFAMGSMLTIAAEGRLIRLTLPAPIVVTTVAPVVSAAPPPASNAPPAPPSVATAATSAPVPVIASVASPSVSQVKVVAPAPPHVPPVPPRTQGGNKLPPLPFPPQ